MEGSCWEQANPDPMKYQGISSMLTTTIVISLMSKHKIYRCDNYSFVNIFGNLIEVKEAVITGKDTYKYL